REGGHAFVGESFGNYGAGQFAFIVVEDGRGAHQVGTGSAARLLSVTERTIRSEEFFSARGSSRIGLASQSKKVAGVAASTASAAARRRHVFLSVKGNSNAQKGERDDASRHGWLLII